MESFANSLATRSFSWCPLQARLKISLVWSAVSFKVETDSDGNDMGHEAEGMPAWIGALADAMGQGSPPPRSTGGSEPWLWLRDGVHGGGVGGQSVRCGYGCWMEHGWRQKRLMLRSVWFSAVTQWAGTSSPSLLCFAAVRWTVMPMQSFIFAISTTFIDTLMIFVPWEASARPIWTVSVVTLFGFLTVSVMVLVAGPVSILVLVLSVLWFLFFIQAAHSVLTPHDAAVHCVEVMVRVTIGKDGFLILVSCQWLSNAMCIKIRR